ERQRCCRDDQDQYLDLHIASPSGNSKSDTRKTARRSSRILEGKAQSCTCFDTPVRANHSQSAAHEQFQQRHFNLAEENQERRWRMEDSRSCSSSILPSSIVHLLFSSQRRQKDRGTAKRRSQNLFFLVSDFEPFAALDGCLHDGGGRGAQSRIFEQINRIGIDVVILIGLAFFF